MDKEGCPALPVDVDAVHLAIEWKALFASELRMAAESLAVGAESVTADHYKRALAPATAKVLNAISAHSTAPADECRRVA